MYWPRALACTWSVMFAFLAWIAFVGYMTGGMLCDYKKSTCSIGTTEYIVYGYAVLFALVAAFAFRVKGTNIPLVTKIVLLLPTLPFVHVMAIAYWFVSN